MGYHGFPHGLLEHRPCYSSRRELSARNKEEDMRQRAMVTLAVISSALVGLSGGIPVHSQSEQSVEVLIKDSTFVTKQKALRLGLPTTITIRNEDAQRHDFGSTMFEGIPTKIDK